VELAHRDIINSESGRPILTKNIKCSILALHGKLARFLSLLCGESRTKEPVLARAPDLEHALVINSHRVGGIAR
jgi:hypothetical protein